MRRLTEWFRRSRPSVGGPAAPAPRAEAPLPQLAPDPGSSAYHQRRAYRYSSAVHMAYGRFLVGHDCVTPAEIAEHAENAAMEWALFAIHLREEAASVDVDAPDDLAGGL